MHADINHYVIFPSIYLQFQHQFLFIIIKMIKKLPTGYRLPPPPGCPRDIYQLMIQCWYVLQYILPYLGVNTGVGR